LKELGIPRERLVISDKVFFSEFPSANTPPNAVGTSAKRIREFITQSLKRLQLDYIDLIFAHRRD
jgi:aryl-alcohol dehydrogenase-like predicted oxidoreductase